MRDFRGQVESRMAGVAQALDPGVIEELAQDLELRYLTSIRNGAGESEAWLLANQQMDWDRLALELAGASRLKAREVGSYRFTPAFWSDLRLGLRQLRRSPGFAATAVSILALAIGANTAIFSVFDALVLRPLPYRNPEQLVRISENFVKFNITGMQVSPVEIDDLRSMTRSYSHMAGVMTGEFALTTAGSAEAVSGLRVSANIFPMLDVQPLLGAPFGGDAEQAGKHRAVVLSEKLWRRRFGGDPAIVGKDIEINREPYRVCAVSRPFLNFLGAAWDLWVPLSFEAKDKLPVTRGSKSVDVIARMRPEISIHQAEQELASVTSRLKELHPNGYPEEFGFSLHATDLGSSVSGDLRDPLLFLLAAVSVLMLIACANVSNLLIARASARRKEMTVRIALGAGRGRLVCQLLTENLVIAAIACFAGIALAAGLLALFSTYGPSEIGAGVAVGINGWVVLFATGVSVLACILFGLIPALTASTGINEILKESSRGSTAGRKRVRDAMVALEVAASVVLLVCAGLLIRSFVRIQATSPGFVPGNVLTFELLLPPGPYSGEARRIELYHSLRERIEALPGVVAVGGADRIPFGGRQGGSPLRVVGRDEDPKSAQPMLRPSRSLPGYFESLGIPLLRGRLFSAADTPNTKPVAIIDEATMKRFFPNGEDPLGKQIHGVEPGLTATIVGVVGSVKRTDLSNPKEMSVYHAASQKAGTSMTFTVKSAGEPLGLIPSIRHVLENLDPLLPLARTLTMEQRLSNSLAKRRLSMQLMMFFGLSALLLAATGLYGVLSCVVDQRRREVGIRIALGAEPKKVVELIALQGLMPVVVGIVAGLLAAAGAAQLLAAMLFEMSPADPLVYGLATTLLVLTALAAVVMPARRAAVIDPMIVLRDE